MQTPIVKITTPAPRVVWQQLMQCDPAAMPYQSPAWLDALCASGGYRDVSRLYELADDRQLLLPLVQRWPLPVAASLPASWGIGGLLATESLRIADVATVFADLARLPYLQVRLRPNPCQQEIWAAACPPQVQVAAKYAHVLDLSGGFDEVWSKRFVKRTRTAIRQAERAGLVVECDTTGQLIPVFYDLLVKSFGRWADKQNEPWLMGRVRGHLRDPLDKFQTIARLLGEVCHVWVAWYQDQPAASLLVLQASNANYARGAMDVALAGPTGANKLLQKLAIEEACRAGCRYYHMGESGASEGLAHYKTRFGAVGYAYQEYYIERLPLNQWDCTLRSWAKQLIGFQDLSTRHGQGVSIAQRTLKRKACHQ